MLALCALMFFPVFIGKPLGLIFVICISGLGSVSCSGVMLLHESYYGLVFFLYCYRYVFAGIVSFLFPVRPVWYEGYLLSISFSRIQLAPHARRGAVPMTVSEWVPVLCANDEVAKSRRTGITIAYTEDMLSRERTMDCIMHYSLGDNTIY